VRTVAMSFTLKRLLASKLSLNCLKIFQSSDLETPLAELPIAYSAAVILILIN
jgi:hypothetical protein